jgi:outer membrane protein TolC
MLPYELTFVLRLIHDASITRRAAYLPHLAERFRPSRELRRQKAARRDLSQWFRIQRPEYEQFARSREVLDNLNRTKAAQDKPRLSAFLRTGYGRPGLNALSDKFDSYWLGGLQVQWTPWNWGNTNRDRQVNALQSQIVSAEESAFTEGLQRALEQDVAAIDRLEKSLRSDDQIIALRENILKETRVRYGEAVITSAEYVDRQTDLLVARLEHALHRVQLSQAHAHLNTTLGLEVR